MKGRRTMLSNVFLLIIGVIAIVLSFTVKKSENKQIQMISAYGIVTNISTSDGGNVCFYVDVTDVNGNIVEAQSIYYSNTHKKYIKGDRIPVKYYYTPKGAMRCEINDSELVSCKESAPDYSKIFLSVGIALVCLSLIMIIKSFI